MTLPPAIEVRNVSKTFNLSQARSTSIKERFIDRERWHQVEFLALDDVSLDVEQGETFGLMGHNGSGKSTLLKCIARTLRPTSGSIRTVGRVSALLELGAGFHPDLTGRENVELNGSILGLDPDSVRARMGDIFAFAELEQFMDTPVKNYSSGMFARLGFAVAMNLEPDVLLVDEVLSVGDESFQRKCMGEVRRFQREGRTIVVVTHDADLIRRVCHRAGVLDHGRLVTVDEPPAAIRTLRELYQARGVAVPREYATADTLISRPVVSITGVRLGFPDPSRQYLLPGEPLRVEIEFEATERVDDLVAAMEIHDAEGRRLLGVNTDGLDTPPDPVEGDGRVVLELESVPLLGGSYSISVGLHNHDVSVSYDHREQGAVLRVENRTRLEGQVWFPMRARWEHGGRVGGGERSAARD